MQNSLLVKALKCSKIAINPRTFRSMGLGVPEYLIQDLKIYI